MPSVVWCHNTRKFQNCLWLANISSLSAQNLERHGSAQMANTAEKNFTYFAPTNVHARVHLELEPFRLLTVAAYHSAVIPCDSRIF